MKTMMIQTTAALRQRRNTAMRTATILCAAAAFCVMPVSAQRMVSSDDSRRIQDVSPMHGPVGTEVSMYTENLPLQARVHVGIGATRTGFEALLETQQGVWGEIEATITIPETAPWDRAVLLVAFDATFAPIGLSDPFHVTRADGILQRTGEITSEGVECLAMRDTDGFLYTLVGNTEGLVPGEPAIVQARYVEASVCMQGTTLDVVRVLPVS